MDEELNLWLVWGGLGLGLLFGALLQRSRLCLVAAFSNAVLMRDFRQVHGYLAALATAIAGTTLLELGGWVDLSEVPYRVAQLRWGALIGGGLVFGLGSMLAGGCAGRTVVRAGEGNLGSLLAMLSFGLAGGATLYGVVEPLRAWAWAHAVAELDAGSASLAAVLALPPWLVAGLLLAACLAGIGWLGERGPSRPLVFYGALAGALIAVGWAVTGWWSQDDFSAHGPATITVAGPLARSTVYLTTARHGGTVFGLFLFAGMLGGALLTALLQRTFRWVAPDSAHVGAYLIGGALMGIGAIFAGGCNIGHGLSGLSTLSLQSLIAVGAILAGMRVGLWWLQRTG